MRNSTSLVLTVIVFTSSFCLLVSTFGATRIGAGFFSILTMESVLMGAIISFGESVFANADLVESFAAGLFAILFFPTGIIFFFALSVLATAGFVTPDGFFIELFGLVTGGAGVTAILCFSLS